VSRRSLLIFDGGRKRKNYQGPRWQSHCHDGDGNEEETPSNAPGTEVLTGLTMAGCLWVASSAIFCLQWYEKEEGREAPSVRTMILLQYYCYYDTLLLHTGFGDNKFAMKSVSSFSKAPTGPR